MENKFLVGVQGREIVVGLAMRTARMSKEDALNLAAWLLSVASNDPKKDAIRMLNAILEL